VGEAEIERETPGRERRCPIIFDRTAKIKISNLSNHIAFFLRVEVAKGKDGDEVLPITYDDNYVTVFPHECKWIKAQFRAQDLDGQLPFVKVESGNVKQVTAALPGYN
jgi:exo-1,4-beta-D-glucosaminidase